MPTTDRRYLEIKGKLDRCTSPEQRNAFLATLKNSEYIDLIYHEIPLARPQLSGAGWVVIFAGVTALIVIIILIFLLINHK